MQIDRSLTAYESQQKFDLRLRIIFPDHLKVLIFIIIIFGLFKCHCLSQNDRLSPDQALDRFVVADGLQVTVFAADPEIVSITNIDIDHRGRVWACECVNYRGNRGRRPEGDRILIMEDTNEGIK